MKEKAIAQLMIATMIVDSHRDQREYDAISGTIGLLGVTEEEFHNYLEECKEINSAPEVVEWSQGAVKVLRELGDPDISSIAIANMVLVAVADNKIKDVEDAFIQQTAASLGVPGPIRR